LLLIPRLRLLEAEPVQQPAESRMVPQRVEDGIDLEKDAGTAVRIVALEPVECPVQLTQSDVDAANSVGATYSSCSSRSPKSPYLATILREEARLAVTFGDDEGARRAFAHYAAFRDGLSSLPPAATPAHASANVESPSFAR
jgi:hypothetical protein